MRPASSLWAMLALAAAVGTARADSPFSMPPETAAPEVRALVAPGVVQLGDRFTLFVTAAFGDGVEVNLREPLTLGDAFEVTRRVSVDSRRTDGRREREWQIEVIAWDLGDVVVPGLGVTFTVGGRAGQVETDPISIHVAGVRAEGDHELRADAPPFAITVRTWWPLVGLGVVVIACAAWRMLRRRRRQLGPVPEWGAVHDRASELALRRLQAIDEAGTLERDRKRGYAEMVEVIRDYLGARYRIATLDLTAGELSRALLDAATDPQRALVDAWLARCELVQYGGVRPSLVEARTVLDSARAVVVATTVPRSSGVEARSV